MQSTKLTKKQIAAEKKLKIIRKKKQERINKQLTGEISSPFLTQTKKPVKKSKKSEVQGKEIKKPKGILKKTETPDVPNEKAKKKNVQIGNEEDTQVSSKKQKRSLEGDKPDKVVLKNGKSDKIKNDSKAKTQDVTKDKELPKGAQQTSSKPKKTDIMTPLGKVNKSIKKDAAATKNKTGLISAPYKKRSVSKAVKPNADKVATQSVVEQSNNENTEEQLSISSDVKESSDVHETSIIEKDLKVGKKKRIRSKKLSRKKLLLKPKTLKRKQAGTAQDTTSRGVCYFSHLPHGFYEKQLFQYCSQFGKVTGVYHPVSKNGNSKGFAFVEFKHSEVAEVVAETMNNYLMFNRLLKCEYVPAERQKPWVFKRTTNLKDIAIANRKDALNNRMKTLTEDECKKRRTKRLAKIRALQKNVPYEIQVYDESDLEKESTSLNEES